ncbi:MAG TPA: hypothetical protein VN823_26630 [Stellaceae bacterium]|nr:hypothetical protein [Stellaceae bacterium]
MQQRAPIETSGVEAETADACPATSRMIPLTHSKMHEMPVPAPEQPLLPRRSALLIEILSFVLIAFLVVSALLFNLTAPRTLISAPPSVSVQLPAPKPVEHSEALPAAGPVVPEELPAAETAPASTAVLQDVQPQAGSEATPQAEPAAETAALPPAAAPLAPEPLTSASIEVAPAPAPAPADETASLPLPAEETEALIRRGDQLLDTGDIVAARSAFERAAASGNRVAALGVAKTYDPVYLTQAGVRGLRGDPARAALWYGKAAAAGDREAQQRLRRLRVQFPQ